MKKLLILILCILIFSGIACSGAANKGGLFYIDAEVVYRSTQCNGPENGPSAEWILNDKDLSLVYGRLRRHIIGPSVSAPPDVDFFSNLILLVDMGRVPTSGYGIDLADSTVKITGRTAEIKLSWKEPAPESIQTQVITSPCILIKLPKAGYDAVTLTDQKGRILSKQAFPIKEFPSAPK